jgi:hypothetical protein
LGNNFSVHAKNWGANPPLNGTAFNLTLNAFSMLSIAAPSGSYRKSKWRG